MRLTRASSSVVDSEFFLRALLSSRLLTVRLGMREYVAVLGVTFAFWDIYPAGSVRSDVFLVFL